MRQPAGLGSGLGHGLGQGAPAGGVSSREPSMEEILASIKRIIEDSDGVRRVGPAEAPAAEEPAVLAAAQEPDPRPDNDAAALDLSAFRDELRPEPAAEFFNGPHASPSSGPFRAEQPAALHHVPVEAAAPRPAIISDRAGRQVAAAFDELNDAFAASRKRSFDEIAEEMMRPMLQDWLDNNLPLLVERLVREEIERVARGGVR